MCPPPAALGDKERGSYAIHLVNKGATRDVKITGLPQEVRSLNIYLTDKENSCEKTATVPVENGEITFELQGAGFTSLMTD